MRPARALIDLDALRHNYRLARELGGGKALAVVKADAYGHGAVACARALEGEADAFAVAAIEEALELRAAGIRAPILLLEGFFDPAELALIEQHDLWFTVATPWQLAAVESARPAQPYTVWLKLDSGMHRLGIEPADYADAAARLQALPHVREVVAMTHFARADELERDTTRAQTDVFDATTATLGLQRSLSNSPGLLGWDDLRSDWVRPGLMLYGLSPFPQPHPVAARLRPVMTLQSQVISVREIAAGEPVGYGAHFVAARPTRVGVVAMGYADGYPQFAPSGTPVAIDGVPGVLIGRVSMDMLTVDLTDHPQAGVGSVVELWGAQVPLNAVAAAARASAYQVPCALKRAAREYVQGGERRP